MPTQEAVMTTQDVANRQQIANDGRGSGVVDQFHAALLNHPYKGLEGLILAIDILVLRMKGHTS